MLSIKRIRNWLTGFVACTLIALFLFIQWFANPALEGETKHWPKVMFHYLLVCYIWGILAIGIYPVTSRIGIDRRRWIRTGLAYLGIGLGFSLAHILISSGVLQVVDFFASGPGDDRDFGKREFSFLFFLRMLQSSLILFTIIASMCLAINYFRKYQDRELRTSRLESELTRVQLDALKSQLQPHFLFNTLNAISALVRENPRAAETMIVRLSDLLRATLEQGDQEVVPLETELEFVRRYLDIEKVRFGDRLIVIEKIAPETLVANVPTLILQPFVENALRHGVEETTGTCTVTILAEHLADQLILRISDDGPGKSEHRNTGRRSMGIANSTNRLQHLFGADHQFRADNRPEGGFEVEIKIPFQPASRRETKKTETNT